MDATEPKQRRFLASIPPYVFGLVVVAVFLIWAFWPQKQAVDQQAAAPKAGDILPIVGIRYLDFAAPAPMKNRSAKPFILGDRCRGQENGSLEVLATDTDRVLAIYRGPQARGTHIVGGVDVTAEDAALDCPENAPVVLSPEEWRALARDNSVTGGSRAALREWVRQHLPAR